MPVTRGKKNKPIIQSDSEDDFEDSQPSTSGVSKELVLSDDSSSESDIESYLKKPNELNLNSTFFQVGKPADGFDDIEKSILSGVNRLSDSESENDDLEANGKEESLVSQIPAIPLISSNFLVLDEYTKKIEEAKRQVDLYNAKKKARDEKLEIGDILAIGEKNEDDNNLGLDLTDLHSSDFESCSDSEKEDWEVVKNTENEKPSIIPKDGVQITVEMPSNMRKKKGVDLLAAMKRRLNRIRKENQVLIHKVHLLCWLAHGNYINNILNKQNLLAAALSLLPSEHCYPPQRMEMRYLEQLMNWYRKTIDLSIRDDDDEVLEESLMEQIGTKVARNKNAYIYILICILRSLGLQTRLVLSLQVEPLRPLASDLHSLSTKDIKKDGDKVIEKPAERKVEIKDEAKEKDKPESIKKVVNKDSLVPKESNNNVLKSKQRTKSATNVEISGEKVEKKLRSKSASKPPPSDDKKDLVKESSAKKLPRKARVLKKDLDSKLEALEKLEKSPSKFDKNADDKSKAKKSTNETSSVKKRETRKKIETSKPSKKPDPKDKSKSAKATSDYFTEKKESSEQTSTKKSSSSTSKNTKETSEKKSTRSSSVKPNLLKLKLPIKATKRIPQVDGIFDILLYDFLFGSSSSSSSSSDEDVLLAGLLDSSDDEDNLFNLFASNDIPLEARKPNLKRCTSQDNSIINKKIKIEAESDTDGECDDAQSSKGKEKLKLSKKLYGKVDNEAGCSSKSSSLVDSQVESKPVNEQQTSKSDENKQRQILKRLKGKTLNNISQIDGVFDSSSDEDSIPQLDGAGDKSGKPNLKRLKSDSDSPNKKTKLDEKSSPIKESQSARNSKAKNADVRSDIIKIVKGRINEERRKSKRASTKTKYQDCDDTGSDSDFLPEEPIVIKKKKLDPKAKVKRRIPTKAQLEEEKRRPKPPAIKTKKGNDIWIEVFVEDVEKWIAIDVITGKIHCVEKLYANASHPISYILSWDNTSRIKDVTKRYCTTNWNTVTRKLRVETPWWEATLKPFKGVTTARDREEDEDLSQQQLDQPIPKTISEFKNHPLYVLKRHLLKFQALYPPDCPVIGFVRGEAVYSRDCVYVLHSREIWVKEAKVVRPGEKPYKIVKARPKYDKLSNTVITDQPLEIFGPWQVQDYEPPVAENGVVPRNAYGNVELFKACMLPKGTVHMQLPGLNKVAKKLNIDCASAVTGFDFHGGWNHPIYDGFVVCQEYEDVLREAWTTEQEEAENREREKYEKRVYGNWKRIIKGLLIREKLKIKYNFGDNSDARNEEEKKKLADKPVKHKPPKFTIRKK